jgi:hypothetical protein
MFYTWHQNNSGGHFTVTDDLAHLVSIEADSLEEAKRIADRIGIDEEAPYCPCCGERWYSEPDSIDDVPKLYGKPVEEMFRTGSHYASFGYILKTHYKDGRVEELYAKNLFKNS